VSGLRVIKLSGEGNARNTGCGLPVAKKSSKPVRMHFSQIPQFSAPLARVQTARSATSSGGFARNLTFSNRSKAPPKLIVSKIDEESRGFEV